MMLVLGMGTLANAGLMLTVNGEDVGDTTDVTAFELGVSADGQLTGFTLEVSTDAGTIDISGMGLNSAGWMFAPYVRSSSDVMVDITGGDFMPKNGPLVVINGIQFDLGASGQALITLKATGTVNMGSGGNIPPGTVLDTLVVTPEPMSLMLLGLGGLFLRRRK
ncbi:MAG: PEP-CTERM sorting domain-containing protein [Phycisphaerae bacterium]|nr:PEP-CTERM sorting domain-containing protein [Phycisphaerae bacterium]